MPRRRAIFCCVEAYRVWAEIDLDALARNLERVRQRAGPGVAVMLVVKADAYGHGAVAVAHSALRAGVEALGVGTSAEALELRKAGIRAPILVLGTVLDEEAPACLRHGVQIALHSSDRRRMLQQLARRLGLVARVHLKIDTGLGRLGASPTRALALLEEIERSDHLELAGIMTHLASPLGALDPATRLQIKRFQGVLESARQRRLVRGWIHAASTASVFTDLRPLYDAVRVGLGAYGALPTALPGASDLEPVMSFASQVVFLKDVAPGTPIGYGGTWRAARPTRIATLSVGYADGVAWRLGNQGHVLIRGQRAPIVGMVSMDYTTIDVGDVPGVCVGDRVTFFGRDGAQRIAVEEVARRAGTIPYELTCAVGRRVERIYVGSETPVRGSPSDVLTPVPPPGREVERVRRALSALAAAAPRSGGP